MTNCPHFRLEKDPRFIDTWVCPDCLGFFAVRQLKKPRVREYRISGVRVK